MMNQNNADNTARAHVPGPLDEQAERDFSKDNDINAKPH